MRTTTYPAARIAAPRLQALFAHHAAEARRKGEPRVATLPDAYAIEAMIGAAFWASLRREEGYAPRISLAYAAPQETAHPLLFERSLPLDPAALTRVAPAVERAGMHLGVWRDASLAGATAVQAPDGGLSVWGTTRSIPPTCLVVEVAAPGLLVVKHQPREGDSGKFVNVAVIEGEHVKLIDGRASSLPDCPALLTSLVGFDAPASWSESSDVLVQLAVSMRSHGRGGLLLVVPAGRDQWRESIVRPILYSVSPPFAELTALWRDGAHASRHPEWQSALGRAVSAVAGLTAVDGAVVMTDEYEVLAFGAKIARRKGSPQIEQVIVTEPIEGTQPWTADPAQLGGTRHLSAAQFVHDERDAVALVASQDGRFTVFAWSPCSDRVHAHRVEALLL